MSKQKHFFPQSTAIDGVSQTSGGITLWEYTAIEICTGILAGRKQELRINDYLDDKTIEKAITVQKMS